MSAKSISVVGITAGGRTGHVHSPVVISAVISPFETVSAGIGPGATAVSTVTPMKGGGRQAGIARIGPGGRGAQANVPTAGAIAPTTAGSTALVNQSRPVAGSNVIPVTVPAGMAAGTNAWASGGPGATGMRDTSPIALTIQIAPGVAESDMATIGGPATGPQSPAGHAASGMGGATTHPG